MDNLKSETPEVLIQKPPLSSFSLPPKSFSLPLRIYKTSNNRGYSVIEDQNGVSVANVWTDNHKEIAEFIVNRCNNELLNFMHQDKD